MDLIKGESWDELQRFMGETTSNFKTIFHRLDMIEEKMESDRGFTMGVKVLLSSLILAAGAVGACVGEIVKRV